MEFLQAVFSTSGFMPHGHCWLWTPALVALEASSNLVIGLSYVVISTVLAILVWRIRDLPFRMMFVAFGAFIVSCGFTHFLDVVVIWHPIYWIDAGVRVVTAVASLATAALMPRLVPKAITVARAADAAHARGFQLENAVHDLERLYEKTREVEEAKTQFFANVSHELRTPLSLILGPTERLLEDSRGRGRANDREQLEIIARNARLLRKHVDDLLEVAKLESGKMKLAPSRADFARLVRSVAGNFDGLAAERHISFVLDVAGAIPTVIDADKIEHVVLNILANAFKFTPEDGRVRVSVAERGDRVFLDVADSGPGVQPARRAAIFERFGQGEGGPMRTLGGTGLGLAIAKDFVALHGGTIEVGDAPEGGALFHVSMPRALAGADPGAAAVEPDASSTQRAAPVVVEELAAALRGTGDGHGESVTSAAADALRDRPLVLIVEDNADMNRFVADTLGSEVRAVSAFDGEDGVAKARALRPDLIITDVMMPRMSGEQLVAAVRAEPSLDRVPILVLTAKTDDALRVQLLEHGAQDYVMKPFAAAELRVRSKNLVVMKRAREILQAEIDAQTADIEALAHEVASKKRELQTALDTMRIARDEALEAAKARSSFLSMVSHELRTPLTTLRLHLDRMKRESATLAEKQRASIDKMDSSSRRLVGMIDSLLDYARIESGRFVTTSAPVDIGALARDVVDELRPRAEAKALSLTVETGDDLPILQSDETAVRLVITNLVENGVKYTAAGSVDVAVAKDRDGEGVVVKVSDTGPGIRPEDRARIFEPFEQAQRVEHKHTPGVGLGLALVREVVEALGGEIRLDTAVDRGSTFSVVLPKTNHAAQAHTAPAQLH